MNKLAAKILINARDSKGLTQTQLAEKLAESLNQTYSLRQYQKLEEGKFPKYKKKIVEQLDKILNTNLSAKIYEQNGKRGTSGNQENNANATDLQAILRDHIEMGVKHQAAINILSVTLAEFVAAKSGRSIAYEHSELQKAISSESDRLLAERQRKK